jgi:hypothetical protein
VDLAENSRIHGREWTFLIRRRARQSRSAANQRDYTTEHEHTDST